MRWVAASRAGYYLRPHACERPHGEEPDLVVVLLVAALVAVHSRHFFLIQLLSRVDEYRARVDIVGAVL
jgi:hypothetical protein